MVSDAIAPSVEFRSPVAPSELAELMARSDILLVPSRPLADGTDEAYGLIAREGLCAMEVVEVSPPYDVNDNTSQLACRVILDVLGTMVVEGKLGHRSAVMAEDA